jgi:hypothetical protein
MEKTIEIRVNVLDSCKKTIPYYLGKATQITAIIDDTDDKQYKAVFTMKAGWTMENLGEALVHICEKCENKPDEINIFQMSLLDLN